MVLRGQVALLNCSAFGISGSQVNITWRKDGTEIVSEGRVTVLSNGSLFIRRVVHKVKRHEMDKGVYECVAANDVGAIVSRQALLQLAGTSRATFIRCCNN